MRRNLRKIAYSMLAVLLATVLSPSFAWEAAAGQSAHEHEVAAPDSVGSAHDEVQDTDGYMGSHHFDEDSHHHHGCAGHALGHLPGFMGETSALALLAPGNDGFAEPTADFRSLFPDRLDRPPLAPTLA